MAKTIIERSPLFQVAEFIDVSVAAGEAYDLVSDLSLSRLWSPECVGGTWSGPPREVGSVFRGENYRRDDVVGWAPLVRGTWFTEAQVLVADRGRAFRWAMRTHTGANQKSEWGFSMHPTESGCRLGHDFEMTTATEGIHEIVAELDEEARRRFVEEWGAKLVDDVRTTLGRIKDVLEQPGGPLAAVAREEAR